MFKGLTNTTTGKAYIIDNIPATINDINNLSETILLLKDELTQTIKEDIYTTQERLEKYNKMLSNSITDNHEAQTDLVSKVGNNLHTTISNTTTKLKEDYDNKITSLLLLLQNEVGRVDKIIEEQKRELTNTDKHTLEIITNNSEKTLTTLLEIRDVFNNKVKELETLLTKSFEELNKRIDKEVENIDKGCYGSMFGNDSEIMVDEKLTIMEQFREDGHSSNMTTSASNDCITFNRCGKYLINYSASIECDNNVDISFWKNDEIKQLRIMGRTGNINTCGIIEANSGEEMLIKVRASIPTKLKIKNCNITLNYLGK